MPLSIECHNGRKSVNGQTLYSLFSFLDDRPVPTLGEVRDVLAKNKLSWRAEESGLGDMIDLWIPKGGVDKKTKKKVLAELEKSTA